MNMVFIQLLASDLSWPTDARRVVDLPRKEEEAVAYVLVQDIAASWAQYQRLTKAMSEPAPRGLIHSRGGALNTASDAAYHVEISANVPGPAGGGSWPSTHSIVCCFLRLRGTGSASVAIHPQTERKDHETIRRI
jgi:hypothetical protein